MMSEDIRELSFRGYELRGPYRPNDRVGDREWEVGVVETEMGSQVGIMGGLNSRQT